jgi:hypothetical protein
MLTPPRKHIWLLKLLPRLARAVRRESISDLQRFWSSLSQAWRIRWRRTLPPQLTFAQHQSFSRSIHLHLKPDSMLGVQKPKERVWPTLSTRSISITANHQIWNLELLLWSSRAQCHQARYLISTNQRHLKAAEQMDRPLMIATTPWPSYRISSRLTPQTWLSALRGPEYRKWFLQLRRITRLRIMARKTCLRKPWVISNVSPTTYWRVNQQLPFQVIILRRLMATTMKFISSMRITNCSARKTCQKTRKM